LTWFFVALAAFFLFSVAVVTDKFMLTKTPAVPVSFSFYISLMGAAVSALLYLPVVVAERRLFFPAGFPLLAVLVTGAAQYFGLLFMFEAVNRGEVSRASPVIVSVQPVFNLFLTLVLPPLMALLFHQSHIGLRPVKTSRLIGVGLVIVGGYLLSQVGVGRTKLDLKAWLYILLAGGFLSLSNSFAGISYAVFDSAYLPSGATAAAGDVVFLKAFIWSRWGALLAGFLYVVVTRNFRALLLRDRGPRPEGALPGRWVPIVFLFGQGAGALAVILQQYAIKVGNVILVSALNGIQFFFVIAITAVLSRFFPKVLYEASSRKEVFQKVGWSAVLLGGIALIVL
jgi:uncharacterized membrane protein